jgi:hypothetical protein
MLFSLSLQLQSCFAKHMLRLEEHREVGNSEASAERLGLEHEQYRQQAMVSQSASQFDGGWHLFKKFIKLNLNYIF